MERSSDWKLTNSLWAILTIFGVFNWIIFIYIGSNSKCRKYTIIGILYSVISFISIFASVLKLVPLSNFVMSFCLIGYPIGIIYSFFNLHSYWERLDLISELSVSNFENKKINSMNNSELKKFIENNEFSSNEINTEIPNKISVNDKKENSFSSKSKTQKIDTSVKVKNEDNKLFVNSASKEELLTIPEISSELAEKIISERKLTNGFKNMEELEERLALKPHISKELENKIIFNNIENIHKNTDSNNNGRIVDF